MLKENKMTLTQRNASKLYDGLCALLGIDSLFIDHNGILHTNVGDKDDDDILVYSLPNPIVVELYGSKIWKEYNDQFTWGINGLISIDDFAYHMRCDPAKIKYQVLKLMLKLSNVDNKSITLTTNSKNYIINNLEELKIKADLRT